ncbi:MAG: DUF4350 domain-containing protein [Candidatus Heimdallarchaeota archaeon]|nr:DUF4350 domain-containing protein [Candidatus Heimdallarchaeota archaeon]
MSMKVNLFSSKYSPFFKMLIQTLLLFVIFTLPLSINITSTPPPYTMTDTGPSGLSTFANMLVNDGYNVTRTLLSTEPIQDLPSSSVLVVVGGAKKYRDSEKAVIDSFVAQGGTLLLCASEGASFDLAEYLGFYLTSSILLDTAVSNTTPSPDLLLLDSPLNSTETLCFFRAKHISSIATSYHQWLILPIYTPNTTFIDENNDYQWNMIHEPLRPYIVASLIGRGRGRILIVTSTSFLTNDLGDLGFSNINTTIKILGNITASSEQKLVCFEESHKRWPVTTTEGIINQTYGSIILLSKTKLFVFLVIIILLLFYYLTPRFTETYRKRDSYKKFISDRMWSRRRELYDTFGTAIKPTVEEQYLSYLYFQHELYPGKAYNYFLAEKLKFIPTQLINEEERKLLELALTRKLDHQSFLFLFKKLEEIQKRKLM